MNKKPVLVYVTHEHGDHYDEETLKKLAPYARELCIPDYENAFFKNHIEEKLGIQPRLLAEDDPQEFHDIQFKIFIDESGINRDSAIFFKSKDLSFFDGNDCKIFDRASHLLETCGSIDIMSAQFSGANMHPICYEMTPGEYKLTAEQGGLKFEGIASKIGDEELKKIVDYYRTVDLNLPACSAPLVEEVLAYFEQEMNSKIEVLKNNPGVRLGCPLYCEVKTGEDSSVVYLIHPERLVLEKVSREAIFPPYYLHGTDVAAIGKLMRSGKGWGTYSLSFLCRNRRVPDIFDSAMSIFFKANNNDDLDFGLKKLNQFRNNDEYIKLTHNEGSLTVTCKRFCPHQGADLKYARFDGKYLVCPRHQWRFDCENDGIADNSRDSINAMITKIAAA